MSDYCLVVASGAHARFFTLEPVEHPEVESGPRLIERGNCLTRRRKEGVVTFSAIRNQVVAAVLVGAFPWL